MASYGRKPQLTLWTKLSYAFGTTHSIFDRVRGVYTTPFLLDVVGLSGYWVGTILLVSKWWDALTDPMIGQMSDTTKSPKGRRRSWIYYFSFPLMVTYVAIWWVPDADKATLIAYYTITTLLFETLSTCVKIPHDCLLAEMGETSYDAMSLSQWRYFGATACGLAAAMLQALIIDANEETTKQEERAYLWSAVLWVAVALPGLYICYFGTFEDPKFVWSKERLEQEEIGGKRHADIITNNSDQTTSLLGDNIKAATWEEKYEQTKQFWIDFIAGAKEIFRYQPYFILVLGFISTIALEFVQSNQFLYLKYVLEEDTEILFYVTLYQTLGRLAAIPLWTRLAKRIGKKKAVMIGFAMMIISQAVYWPLQKGNLMYYYILTPIRGAAGTAPVLLIYAMVADVIDLDELETGKRREGLFYSFLIFVQKISIAIALAVSSYALAFAGYDSKDDDASSSASEEEETQKNSVLLALRLMSSFVPSFILMLGAIALSFYNLTPEQHNTIKAQLEERSRSRGVAGVI